MKWRPIKSAPKDRLILLSCDENPEYPPFVCVGRWIDVPHFNCVQWLLCPPDKRQPANFVRADIQTLDDLMKDAKKNPYWHYGYVGILKGGDGYECYDMRGGIVFRPTHWMDLPEPPKTKRRK